MPFDFVAPDIPLVRVEARASDRPIVLVIDTGAVGPYPLFISEAFAADMQLALSAPITPARSTAIGPTRHNFRLARLPSFRLGPLALRDVEISVTGVVDSLSAATGRTVHAIVGYDLLKNHRVGLDYASKQISFDAPAPAAASLPLQVAPKRPITLVSARINGRGPFTLELDTGASASSFSPHAARRAGIKALGTGRMVGAGGAVTVRVGQAQVTWGPVSRALPMVNITDEVARVGQQSGTRLDGILGADFLLGTRLTLDYPAHRAWIEEVPTPQP